MGNYGNMLKKNLLELGCANVEVTDVFGKHQSLFQVHLESRLGGHDHRIVDEEAMLEPADTYDGVIGSMNMHWINDLESTPLA